MSAYCFFDVLEIHDQKKIDEYVGRVEATVEQYQGRYVLIGGHWDVVEGDYQPVFPVII